MIKTSRVLKRLRSDFQLSIITLMCLLGVVGVKLTPNGVTARQIDELEAYVGRHRA